MGVSGAYAQTPETYHGQGGQGPQFSQHGNFTNHQHTPGGLYSGTFSRNGTAYSMNSFNHTKNAFPRGNNATGHMQTQGTMSSSPSAIMSTTASTATIPTWIKNNAKYWSQGQLGDSDFISGIQYLVQHGIMKIPPSSPATPSFVSQQIPSWIKTNAGYWAGGQISDDDFVKGIQYLVSSGMIKIS